MARAIAAAALRRAILGDGELAVLDVREEGGFAQGHLLLACPLPLSRLELGLADLVPRRSTPIVLCDDDDRLAGRAAEKLAGFGYTDVAVLDGGLPAWRQAGFELFGGVHVYAKAFGEVVEQRCHTPSIGPAALKARLDAGERLVLLDARPFDEYRRMTIPGAIDCPGGELVLRAHELAPHPDTPVVVTCAGRTRSIIGAQSLINAGLPNPVMALANGTMGWKLAGYALESESDRQAGFPSAAGLAAARARAEKVGRHYGVARIDHAVLARWRAEAEWRTLHLLDVRTAEDYAAGHLPGSVHAPGGQLVQATDRWVATLGARIVLVDDDGVRATMTGHWLHQMGLWQVAVLAGAFDGPCVGDGRALDTGRRTPPVLGLEDAAATMIAPAELARRQGRGDVAVIDLATSPAFRAGRVPGARFAVRSRLAEALGRLPPAGARPHKRQEPAAPSGLLVLTSPDGVVARLAAREAAAHWSGAVAVLAGGTAAWAAADLPLKSGTGDLADAADDEWLKPYDQGDERAASAAYLAWETALVDQVARDGTHRFRPGPAETA